jgi:Flp pilus assembly protein TadG
MITKIRSFLHRGDDRGSSTLELAIWGPVLLIIIGLLIVGGRIALAGNAVQSAAFAAAREATIARDSSQAQSNGEAGANFSLNSNGINCISRSVSVDTSAFNQPLGTAGNVTATLTCTVNLSDAAVPGLPGAVNITRTATSPVDPYRQR